MKSTMESKILMLKKQLFPHNHQNCICKVYVGHVSATSRRVGMGTVDNSRIPSFHWRHWFNSNWLALFFTKKYLKVPDIHFFPHLWDFVSRLLLYGGAGALSFFNPPRHSIFMRTLAGNRKFVNSKNTRRRRHCTLFCMYEQQSFCF